MLSKATVELDFFGMEKQNSAKSQFQKLLEQGKTVRGIQSAISKINPQLLKTVIASGSATVTSEGKLPKNDGFRMNGALIPSENPFSVPSTPKGNQSFVSALPVLSPIFGPISENAPETSPLTIFYNGTVSVFDVPREKAEKIMKLAEISKNANSADSKLVVSPSNESRLLENLNGDLPIARKKSLQRFLEKRKERLTSVSPYGNPEECVADKKMESVEA